MKAWKRLVAGVVALMTAAAPTGAQPETPAPPAPGPSAYVDPFIGTDGTGHTFPGPARPFGMIQPGPDNADTGWDYTSGYQYRAPQIIGFSHTRASGTGIPELGDVLLMPSATRRAAMASGKADEVARAGYHAVTLPDNGVKVELTSSLRSAMHRYTFAQSGRVWVLVDLQHGLTFRTDEQPVQSITNRFGTDSFEGEAFRRNWTKRTIAWSVRFNRPIAAVETLPPRKGDAAPRYVLAFDLPEGESTLLVKAGMATTDPAGARGNRDEVFGWDFDALAAAARAEWDALLARATIEGPEGQQRVFTTALYHVFLHPSVVSDADGRFRGPDGTIRTAPKGHLRYSTFSLWDTFRAAHPLYTLLVPERVDDFVASLLDHQQAAGRLPKWPIWGGETGTMIGEPALPVIAEAWAKGFRGFDGQRALAAMVATSTRDASPIYEGDHSISQWSLYDRYGYYPTDATGGEAVSRSLEAGIGDAATARMAAMLGDTAEAKRFGKRAESWRKLIDPETRLARGRDAAGKWREPFDPLTPTSPLNNPGDYTEANAWQYTWTPALHDPEGLVKALGGRKAAGAMLDRFFFELPVTKGAEYLGQEAMIGQYAHGNEPSHHVAWLYAYTDRPERTAALVRRIAESFYRDTPDGLVGNEDAGQMSAWYVFATLGFYPLDPVSAHYVAGLPLTPRAVLRVPGRAELTIEQAGCKEGPVGVSLGGKAYPVTALPHAALVKGGTLTLTGCARR
ncbi:GH92 family glycosyl hydrolase [Erythrobacter sp. CCH5-A1]|jgi:predicted alpha-1,2-mannosidase|uniref:GH92 family glycosyl hydrolase n=1 Tax=Erythrobacter sp. CCH5-A1 TaxID=1768792 RepID=UPI000832BE76|nr:GH92 family glycosyl hydrolase [Erythrobacter sp. CCH5-A1]